MGANGDGNSEQIIVPKKGTEISEGTADKPPENALATQGIELAYSGSDTKTTAPVETEAQRSERLGGNQLLAGYFNGKDIIAQLDPVPAALAQWYREDPAAVEKLMTQKKA